MDLLAGQLLQVLLGVLVGVDDDPGARLGGLVQPRGVRRADVDPGDDPPGEIADRDGGSSGSDTPRENSMPSAYPSDRRAAA